jgi:hypothetical protein
MYMYMYRHMYVYEYLRCGYVCRIPVTQWRDVPSQRPLLVTLVKKFFIAALAPDVSMYACMYVCMHVYLYVCM